MNYAPQLTWFAFTRCRLGITQQQLANSLGISRSLLAMAETGKRKLPQSAMAYLQEMQVIAQQLPVPEPVTRRRVMGFVPLKEYNRIAPKTIRCAAALANHPAQEPAATLTWYKVSPVQQYNGNTAAAQQLHCRLQYLQLEKKNAGLLSILYDAQLKGFNIRIACREKLLEQYPTHRFKSKWLCKKKQLEQQQFLLQQKSCRCNAAAIIERDQLIKRLKVEFKGLELLIKQTVDPATGIEKHLLQAVTRAAA